MRFFYFIHSPHSEVIQKEKRLVKSTLLKEELSLHTLIFSAKTTSIERILEEISNPSLLQQKKIFFIHDYSALKEAGVNQIVHENADNYIFFLEESIQSPATFVENFCKKNPHYSKLLHKPYGMSEKEIQTWILQFLREHHISVTDMGKKILLLWGYKHPDRIEVELQKLLCYTSNDLTESIGEDVISALFTSTESPLPFELGESIFLGNGSKSLELLCRYTLSNPIASGAQQYLGIVSLLLKECNILLDLINETSQGRSSEPILTKYQVRGQKRTTKILSFAEKFTKYPSQLRKIAIWLANFDTFLKSNSSISSYFGYCIPSTLFFQKLILSCGEK